MANLSSDFAVTGLPNVEGYAYIHVYLQYCRCVSAITWEHQMANTLTEPMQWEKKSELSRYPAGLCSGFFSYLYFSYMLRAASCSKLKPVRPGVRLLQCSRSECARTPQETGTCHPRAQLLLNFLPRYRQQNFESLQTHCQYGLQ